MDGPFGSNLKSSEYTDHGIRLIQLQNIGEGHWLDDNKRYISPSKFEALRRHGAQPGDIAIAKMADPVARACLIPLVSSQFIVVADCIKLTVDRLRFDPQFVVYAINSRDTRREAENKSIGTTRRRINLSVLKTVSIYAPPLPEQRRIAQILDTLDEAICRTEQLVAKLKQVKQGLLHDLLTRGIDDNGELRDPEQHPEQFVNSKLGRIPRKWEAATVGSKMAVRGGKRIPAGHTYAESPTGFRYLRVQDFFERKVAPEDLVSLRPSTFEVLSRYEILPGNLYISIAGSLGFVGVYRMPGTDRVVLTENAARLVPTAPMCEDFVMLQMNSDRVQSQIRREAGIGGGVPKLALFRIERLGLLWPSIAEQHAIAETVTALSRRIQLEEQALAKVRLLRRGAMEDLLAGRVRVTQRLDDPTQ